MEMPEKFVIDDVPHFKSLRYPYYCTEASLQMVYEYFCTKYGLDQDKIEILGGKTYEGGKEFHDLGAYKTFKKLGFNALQVNNDDTENDQGNAAFFGLIKEKLYERKLPVLVRLIDRETGWNHTVVGIGFDGDELIANDPDGGSGERIQFPSKTFDLTSVLLVDRPEKCTRFK